MADIIESEETKVDQTNVDEPKVYETKVDQTKVDETIVDQTKVDETKVDETKVEEAEIDPNAIAERKFVGPEFDFDADAIKPSAELIFENVCVSAGHKKILNNISGKVNPGEILALMGPSGSGKTTLLNFISYRHELLGVNHSGIKGTVKINNKLVTKKDKRRIGYVMQQDFFFPSLSLWETLKFYATIRLPKSMTQANKEKKVMGLIKFFNLENSLKTLMGGGFIRGLSGGEKKRANIIVEMITDPELIFLDEPTSGLDSNMAMSLVSSLKNLAVKTNKTIIASIHQPNSHIFFSFSNLLLITQGNLAYFGPVSEVSSYFSSLDMPCPPNWNIADHMIDMARAEQKVINKIIEGCKQKCTLIRTDENPETPVFDQTHHEEEDVIENKNMSSYSTQFNSLLRRSFYNSIFEVWTFTDFLKNIIVSLIVGIVFFDTHISDRSIQTFLGFMFFMSINIFQDPMFSNIFKFAPELLMIRKERMSGMYQLSAYYLAKLTSDMLILIVRPFIVWIIVYFMGGLSSSGWFVASLLWMFIVSFNGQALGLLIASLGLPRMEALTLTVVFFVLVMLLGGFYNRNLPVWLSWVKYFSPFHYAYVIQTWIQLEANGGLTCEPGVPNIAGYIEPSPYPICANISNKVPSSEAILATGAIIHPGWYVLITFAYIAMCHIFGFFALRHTMTKPLHGKTLEEKIAALSCWKYFKSNKKQPAK